MLLLCQLPFLSSSRKSPHINMKICENHIIMRCAFWRGRVQQCIFSGVFIGVSARMAEITKCWKQGEGLNKKSGKASFLSHYSATTSFIWLVEKAIQGATGSQPLIIRLSRIIFLIMWQRTTHARSLGRCCRSTASFIPDTKDN